MADQEDGWTRLCTVLATVVYERVERDRDSGVPLYWCAYCGTTSVSPDDIANQYCGWCRRFAEMLDPTERDTPRALMTRALAKLLVEDFDRFKAALRCPTKLLLAPPSLTTAEAVEWYAAELKKQYS